MSLTIRASHKHAGTNSKKHMPGSLGGLVNRCIFRVLKLGYERNAQPLNTGNLFLNINER